MNMMKTASVGLGVAVVGVGVWRALRRRRQATAGDNSIAVINDPSEWAAASSRSAAPPGFAFYSSVTDAITTNPDLFCIPIDDHAIVRGHAVFDTCSLSSGRMYRLQIHLQRLFSSAAAARLKLPFGEDLEENRRRMTQVVAAACRASGQTNADVRFWLTAGTGNLGVTPDGCKPSFFVLVFGGLPMNPKWTTDGISEVVIHPSDVPTKPKMLAELKSNNYLINALMMMAAKDRGGTFGVAADAGGKLLESCVLNIVVIGKDGVLRTPPFENALAGTTVRRIMELAKRSLVSPSGGDGGLRGVSQEALTVGDALDARELFLCAGDTHLFPITTFEGKPVGDGRIGSVTKKIGAMLHVDAHEGADQHQSIHDY